MMELSFQTTITMEVQEIIGLTVSYHTLRIGIETGITLEMITGGLRTEEDGTTGAFKINKDLRAMRFHSIIDLTGSRETREWGGGKPSSPQNFLPTPTPPLI